MLTDFHGFQVEQLILKSVLICANLWCNKILSELVVYKKA